jgi:lysophospholipase L1-like esterase
MFNPFDGVVGKIKSSQNALIQVCGDSTGQGLYGYAATDPSNGWVGRLGIVIAADYDSNLQYHGATYPGSTTWSGYNINQAVRTSTNTLAPTLSIYNGSMGGAQATNLITWINSYNLIPYTNPDIVFIACGFNDVVGGANLLARIQSLVAAIRTRCPDAPIVITTQNRTTGTYPTSRFLSSYSQVSNYYVGQPLNITPAMIKSEVQDNVWVMDTQQAFSVIPLTQWMSTNDTVGGLHPNALGYQAQAEWMYQLAPRLPVITTTSLNSFIRSNLFVQTLTASGPGVTWSVTAGSMPDGIQLNSQTGTLSGIPTAFGGNYTFTVSATNSFGHDELTYSGSIDRNALPFTAANTAKLWFRGNGSYYPAVNRVKVSGSFKNFSTRN